MTRYKNPWHERGKPELGPEFYEADAVPVEYRGFLIYQRIERKAFDVVRDGECFSCLAGLGGAKSFIDQWHAKQGGRAS